MTISEGVPASITTPDTVKTRLGTLEFRDGAPTPETAERLYHHLPPNIPESRFWPVMVYDRQTLSELQTYQPFPSLGSQTGTVEQNPDGSTDLYFGPQAPPGRQHNWIQTIQAEAGSQSCASTAPSSPSSTRAGGPARPNPRTSAPTDSDDAQTGHRSTQQGKENSRESRAARYPNIKPGQEFTGYA